MHEGIQLKSQNKKVNQIVKEFHGIVVATTVTLIDTLTQRLYLHVLMLITMLELA